ncbi:MAG: two pore domain potassium channel family protein [Reyranella sp.]|uniref:ion channel n=1 Tax=Reyranella sp. TaxID=1929291 RepID=UPI0012274A3E|nr:ion channel [Reyranella sp.]TAJ85724.1 MAG: two pore domain potassium channel family protein [Reyranella sp.]TBR27522.1 MAG: two pore domain potassium channel family protein [Reyranella sp.]
MLLQFVVGAAACICNIAIHALVMLVLVRVAQGAAGSTRLGPSLLLITIMVATVSVLMMAHGLEVLVWALTYAMVGAVPAGADVLYFAFVNYTTLAYGDVLPVERWRLIGPTTAMCGVLMFGWSTAVIFEVLRRALAAVSALPPPSSLVR